jgi:hypothetical protein
MTRKLLAWGLLAMAIISTLAYLYVLERRRSSASLAARLEQIIPVEGHSEASCAELAATQPLILLALGQSNAGNHGLPPNRTLEPITLIADGKCIKATDPLPGGTGTGGSIWQRLPALLSAQGYPQPIALSVLAVDATSIADWTGPHSPLKDRLISHLASMHRLGLTPNFILWQQGEADAQLGTSSDDYAVGLGRLATMLREAGMNVPIILASSTICRSTPNMTIRRAIESTLLSDNHFRQGPDTDILSGETFRNGCHLTAIGLDSAAKMWATAIYTEVSVKSLVQ